MLDSLQPVTGIPDLLTLLQREFETQDPQRSVDDASASDFIVFARAYLARHRPVNLSHGVDSNYQIQLANRQTFVLAPPLDRGSLPPAEGAIFCGQTPVPATGSDLPPAAGAVFCGRHSS